MHRRIAVALGVLALATLTACTAPSEDTNTPAPNPPVTSEEQQPAGADEFIEAIKKIDPELAEDPQKALNRAGNVCGYVDEDEATQLKAVTDRWDGLSDSDAKALLAAIKEHIC